jgi:hypothetical protein
MRAYKVTGGAAPLILYLTLDEGPAASFPGKNPGSEICALLGYYATSNGNPLPTFRDKLSGPASEGQEVQEEKSVKDYHSKLRNTPEEHRSHQHRGGSLKSWKARYPLNTRLGGPQGRDVLKRGRISCSNRDLNP